jgi:hypothetical protein
MIPLTSDGAPGTPTGRPVGVGPVFAQHTPRQKKQTSKAVFIVIAWNEQLVLKGFRFKIQGNL